MGGFARVALGSIPNVLSIYQGCVRNTRDVRADVTAISQNWPNVEIAGEKRNREKNETKRTKNTKITTDQIQQSKKVAFSSIYIYK